MTKRLSRNSDPSTSHEAAAQLDFANTTSHDRLLDWLKANGPATDQEIVVAMIARSVYDWPEKARRAVRTIREEHGLMVPAFDDDGKRLRHKNPESGAWANCWKFGLADLLAPVDAAPDAYEPPSIAAGTVCIDLIDTLHTLVDRFGSAGVCAALEEILAAR